MTKPTTKPQPQTNKSPARVPEPKRLPPKPGDTIALVGTIERNGERGTVESVERGQFTVKFASGNMKISVESKRWVLVEPAAAPAPQVEPAPLEPGPELDVDDPSAEG